jgi:hypothetical protein
VCDGLGSVGGVEFLVEVFDVGLDGGAADAELVADGGEGAVGGQEGEDAGFGGGQGRGCAGRLCGVWVSAGGDGPSPYGAGLSVVIGRSG